jgi:hypothetical protein
MNIAGISLLDKTPSAISHARLYCWTKYSVGRAVGGEYRYGAVKPPGAGCQWLPAAVSSHTILIASLKSFPTPEAAVEWLQAAG